MGRQTQIPWCHHTFNSWRGCSKISDGCKFCYADAMSARNPGTLGIWGPNGSRVVASESMWRNPLAWDREAKAAGDRRRVFCASLADVFEDWQGPMVDSKGNRLGTWHGAWPWAPGATHEANGFRFLTMDDVRARLISLIDSTPHLDWLLLTKRPEGIADRLHEVVRDTHNGADVIASRWLDGSPPPNVWLGVSAENQAEADRRIPILLDIPAAVRFVSAEPLLGPIDFRRSWWVTNGLGENHPAFDARIGLDWIICGGESGSGARPCDVAWLRSIRDQCKAAGVACFVKQLGSNPYFERYSDEVRHTEIHPVALRHPKGEDPAEWPDDLRVRQFPETETSH